MEIWISRIVALLAVAMVVAIVARRLRLPYTVGLVLTVIPGSNSGTFSF